LLLLLYRHTEAHRLHALPIGSTQSSHELDFK
jgi:hypothetical protein